MTSLAPYIPPPGPRRRASDLETIDMDALGPIEPMQALAVIERDRRLASAFPSTQALIDATLREKYIAWGMHDGLPEFDAIEQDRRQQERYGAEVNTSLDHVFDGHARSDFAKRYP